MRKVLTCLATLLLSMQNTHASDLPGICGIEIESLTAGLNNEAIMKIMGDKGYNNTMATINHDNPKNTLDMLMFSGDDDNNLKSISYIKTYQDKAGATTSIKLKGEQDINKTLIQGDFERAKWRKYPYAKQIGDFILKYCDIASRQPAGKCLSNKQNFDLHLRQQEIYNGKILDCAFRVTGSSNLYNIELSVSEK